jgi:hypothetical protein
MNFVVPTNTSSCSQPLSAIAPGSAGERRAALVREKCERRGLTVNDLVEVRLFANYSR